MRKIKRDTSRILMENVLNLVKESGNYQKAERIIENSYFFPAEVMELSHYEFDFKAAVTFGGNEGMYLDCWLEGVLSENQSSKSECMLCGTFKSLNTDLESMQILGELGGSLTYYANKYISREIKRYYPATGILFDEYKEMIKKDKASGGIMKVNHYKTNLVCPRCGRNLYTSDIAGYPFVCCECDENFYGIETNVPADGYVSMEIPVRNKVHGSKLIDMINPIYRANNCSERFLDPACTIIKICWDKIPSAEEIRNMAIGIALYEEK